MANGKIILVIMLCVNIAAFAYAASCSDAEASCGEQFSEDTFLLGIFYDDLDQANVSQSGGLSTTEQYASATNKLNQTTSIGVSSTVGFSVLDGLLMILALFSLLTPVPIIALVVAFQFPLLFTLILIGPILILYTVSLAEFISGRRF